MIAISLPKLYLIWMIKSVTGEFLESCKWAHDKFTWRDVKYVINGRSGGAGMSKLCKQSIRPKNHCSSMVKGGKWMEKQNFAKRDKKRK